MKTQPTFVIDGKLLVGHEAKDAWAAQSVRCACSSYGDADHSISGSCSDMPAEWLGCTNCRGQALGQPLVYRLQSQINAKRADLTSRFH